MRPTPSIFIPLPEGPALRFRAPHRPRFRLHRAAAFALALLSGYEAQAGDILRGGAAMGQRGSKGGGGPLNAAAEQARVNAKDVLARTTYAMQSVKAMQSAAREAALRGPNNLGKDPNNPGRTLSNVPDGLMPGGLQVAPGVPRNLSSPQTGEDSKLWQGALLPKQKGVSGRTVVTIEQLKPQAILNWKTFNVGKKTTVRFSQGRGGEDKSQWTAFNKINDPSGSPSQILGNIEAPGQVYLINPNGIMFGGSSQINLHGLVASSLPINDNLISRGLLNNTNLQYLFAAASTTEIPFALTPVPATPDSFAFTPTQNVVGGTVSVVAGSGESATKLKAGTHYTIGKDSAGKPIVNFTATAIQQFTNQQVTVSYINRQGGDVVVKEGAILSSPTTGNNVGGRIMLVGPNVKNAGTISTPDGQTVLAAGLQAAFAAHASNDPSLRGLDAYIGLVGGNAGRVTNTGLIDAPRANTTMVGKNVEQLGVIHSTTSVTLNGSINLLANYGAQAGSLALNIPFSPSRTGTVTLGPGSVVEVLPELESEKKVVGSQLALRSKVIIQGQNIRLGEGSTLLAPSADVALQAGTWQPSGGINVFTYNAGQVYAEAGAIINVAGTTNVEVPIAQNILSLELRGPELADSPLQRTGPLRGPTLNLDVRQKGVYNGREWVGTPLGDASGYVGLIERNVGELTAAGGTVSINAGSSVVLQPGSKVDVSGGYLNFQGGMVATTRVMSDGRIVDISNATPDRPFTGIYDGTYTTLSPKYGYMQKWSHPLALSGEYFDPGYLDGRNGGNISITAPSMALDGEMLGRTIAGPRQRTAAAAPKLSAINLAFEQQDLTPSKFFAFAPTPPVVRFEEGTLPVVPSFTVDATGAAPALPAARLARVILSPKLFTEGGFGSLTINNGDGGIVIPEETELKLPARGTLSLAAGNLTVDGKVSAPGGTLNFTAYNFTPYLDHRFPDLVRSTPEQPIAGRGNFELGSKASLNVAGLIVDDRPLAPDALTAPLAIDGGSISIAGFNVRLAQGSAIDASGGVAFAKDAKRTYGAGGSISIKAGNDPKVLQIIGGQLELGARLSAFSGAKGGSLTVQAPSVQIGGTTTLSPNTLLLQPEFFSQGGFSTFTISGLGEPIAGRPLDFIPGVSVTPGTVIKPVALTTTAVPYGPNGPYLSALLQPEALRSPVSLTLSAPGVRDEFSNNALVTRGDVILGLGARIETDARGAVTLSGDSVTVLGSVSAPGGTITVAGANNAGAIFGNAEASVTSVYLGPQSSLSAKGTVVYTPNPFGQRTGTVLPGGKITVSGNIVASAGAVLDVSGTSAILDLAPPMVQPEGELSNLSPVALNSGVNTSLYSRAMLPTRVESDGGEIILAGGQHLFSDATLLGNAGGPSALGGSLTVSSGRFYLATAEPSNPLDVTLQVTQSGPTIPGNLTLVNGTAVGQTVKGADGVALQGFGRFAADSFTKGGFDALTLRNTVQFVGPVSIAARRTLSVAGANGTSTGGVIYTDSEVKLKAPYVSLGTSFLGPRLAETVFNPFTDGANLPYYFEPTYGTGSLTVEADLIDIGFLSLQHTGQARFIADGGDIRGNGTLNVAGHIYLRAAQIYPPTAVTFNIAASDYKIGDETLPGSVTIEGSGVRQLPFSAGGQLNVYASDIHQGGTLRAPMGGINLGWDGNGTAPIDPITHEAFAVAKSVTLAPGSFTSVSAIELTDGAPLVIPYGLNVNGVTWIDPQGRDITAGGVTQKTINISAGSVNSMAGSQIDIRGGGDLYAYRWVSGIGGTKDILASTTSFAVVPSYGSNYAPYAPFGSAGTLNGNPGYVNNALRVGDRVHLTAASGLPEGDYTLLPARYALLPGAFLITPKAGTPIGTLAMPDGSMLVPGYRYNNLNQQRELNPQYSWFEVLSPDVLRTRSEYADYYSNEFLRVGALSNEASVPRLPGDAGHLTLQATSAMTLKGHVTAQAPGRSRSGLVDIASPVDILITANGGTSAGKLVLSASQLSSFGAESLLIGGIRKETGAGTIVTVKTNNLTVDNAGTPLKGPEIILVSNQKLTLAEGAQIIQEGKISGGADTLVLGNASTPGSGDGTLLRVTSDPSAQIVRNGLGSSTTPNMVIGAGAVISGAGVTLDSTYATSLDETARISATNLALNSGQISIQLENAGILNPTSGLVLGGAVLRGLESSQALSLLSYSTIDVYGTGTFAVAGRLALHAAQIRGFNTGVDGKATLAGRSLALDNSANATFSTPPGATQGTLELRGGTINLGKGQLAINHFDTVELSAGSGIITSGDGGLKVQKHLVMNTPLLTAARSATKSITAGGALSLVDSGGGGSLSGGLGASLTLEGQSVTSSSDIVLPSGSLTVRATTGDVNINGRVNLNGTTQNLYDLVRFTSGGQVKLMSDHGSVNIGADSVISVSAPAAGGNAGQLAISAPEGSFNSQGEFVGKAGARGVGGSFALDTRNLPNFSQFEEKLLTGGFSEAQSFRVRQGNVEIDGTVKVNHFKLSADQGSITVTGQIDASGDRGGSIALAADGSVIIDSGATLTVHAKEFDAAGKGGTISLETRGTGGGMVDIRTGSTLDLGVDSTLDAATNAAYGRFSGVLHLRAPQISGATDVAIANVGGNIQGASLIIVEGYKVYNLASTNGQITSAITGTGAGSVRADGNLFMGNADTIQTRIFGANSPLAPALSIRPGAELVNANGNITLGTAANNVSDDWNLATYRFGAQSTPGMLTMRASGNLVFLNTLSDGFNSTVYNSALLNPTALPANGQSWSYRLVAGADLTAVDFAQVKSLSALAVDSGSLLLGKNYGAGTFSSGANATTATALLPNASTTRYQAIRTGSGDITIVAGRDVQLLNQFATIFTAGTKIATPTVLPNGGQFDMPDVRGAAAGGSVLGGVQQNPPAQVQFTMGGGNVTISAGADIAHYTRIGGVLMADSSRQLPVNWLYRRGYVDPATGEFGKLTSATFVDTRSTAWWVDFTNFFEGVGALGGGNVTLTAGRDIANVDAVIPTNARMSKTTPNAANLVELGGGDLVVRAGNNIDGGVYYVERGHGTLTAGGEIKTNSTRSPSLGLITGAAAFAPETWLPTTLFVGKAGFDVSARGDLLIGPAANPFLLPGGYNNIFWNKSYFSTYSAESAINVTSLSGDVTLRASATLPTQGRSDAAPILQTWFQRQLLLTTNNDTAASFQPWLRLNESSVAPFSTVTSLMPGTLKMTAFAGDINIVGAVTLAPSSRGTLELAASGAVNGLNITGVTTVNDIPTNAWGVGRIIVSDANPASIPGVATPLAYTAIIGPSTSSPTAAATTGENFLIDVNALFEETGSLNNVLLSKQALHSPGLLHAGDTEPVRIYAGRGDISGLALYSPKAARILAGQNISDIAFYLQNVGEEDLSTVAAGRDITAYTANSPRRVQAQSDGNALNLSAGALAGDIQISGPGTLEVLAGRDLDLGVGPNNPDGTGLGIVSVGNARNPFLPFAGADLVVGAGVGPSTGLSGSALDFTGFISNFLSGASASRYEAELSEILGGQGTTVDFESLPPAQQNLAALQIFYLLLRDAGRDHNDPTSPGFDNYDGGYAAIAALFPGTSWKGDISLTAREIKTRNGGSVSVIAPGGEVVVGFDAGSNQALDQGILTESGGNIHIFSHENVTLGTSRIFTLRGGNEIIWSSAGDIAAGTSSKTVQSAPPTRVLIDPQSADLKTDLAGLATGGGIGVLSTVAGVEPGDVDLIAPGGAIDAGDAGIRVAGNLNISATQVRNAENIQVTGASVGAPSSVAVAAPVISVSTPAPPTSGNTGPDPAQEAREREKASAVAKAEEPPSVITVEVLGYGGGEG